MSTRPRRTFFAMVMLLVALSGCGFYQTCPPAEDVLVPSGTFSGEAEWSDASDELHQNANDWRLSVDRESGDATLSFDLEDGRTVRVQLVEESSALLPF